MYLEAYAKEIEAAGKMLLWLGLATPDNESPLGLKPSHELIRLIVKPRKRVVRSKKRLPTAPDEEAINMILDAALRDVVGRTWCVTGYVLSVLGYVGLLNLPKMTAIGSRPNGSLNLVLRAVLRKAAGRNSERYAKSEAAPALTS